MDEELKKYLGYDKHFYCAGCGKYATLKKGLCENCYDFYVNPEDPVLELWSRFVKEEAKNG